MFDENFLNNDNFKGTINEVQRKLIKNIYTKRLSSQLSDAIGLKLLNEPKDEKLHRFFSGDAFKFFDAKGNFVGDHLKVIEEITAKIKTRYIDGKSLEDELSIAPWGYAYGTISTSLAVLFRAGRLVIKFNDSEYFSYTDESSHEVFNSSTKFKSARYKSINKTLNASQKSAIIQTLLGLNFEEHTNNKLGYNASDFAASDAVTQLADYFITSLNTLKKTQTDFDKLFSKVGAQKDVLQRYSGKTTEANYIEKAEDFLKTKNEYTFAIKSIINAEKFIKKNLDKIKGFDRFVIAVNNELKKAGIQSSSIENNTLVFNEAMAKNVIENFAEIQNAAQNIKDAYHALMSSNAREMTTAYERLKVSIQSAQKELKSNYPSDLNGDNTHRLENLMAYCENKMIDGVRLEYHIECQDSKFSLSDIINYIALAPSKEAALEVIKGSFVKEAPKSGAPKEPKKINLSITKKVMTTKEYRDILASQLQAMAGMDNKEEVEVTVNKK